MYFYTVFLLNAKSSNLSVSCVHIGKCSLLPGAGTNKTQPGVRCLSCQAGPGVFFSPNLSRFHFLWSNPLPTLLGPLPTLSFTLCLAWRHSSLPPPPSVQLSAQGSPRILVSVSWPRCCVRLKVTVSDCEEVTATPHSVPVSRKCLLRWRVTWLRRWSRVT